MRPGSSRTACSGVIVLSVGAFWLAYHSGRLLEDVLLSVLGLADAVLSPLLGDLAQGFGGVWAVSALKFAAYAGVVQLAEQIAGVEAVLVVVSSSDSVVDSV